MRFEQPLTLNVSGYTSGILEQSIEIGSGHSDEPAEDRRPESRCPQVLPNDPPHPFLASGVDLRPSDGDTLGRRGGGDGDHRADRARKPRKIGPRQVRQVVLEGHHIVAEQMPERRVQSRPAGGIEQRRNISEPVARHEERDPVYMRPLMQEFLSERSEKGHFRRYLDRGPSRVREMRAPHAVADNPMIDRIAPEVALRFHKCTSAGNPYLAEC